jgi:hypothetical protein
MTTATQPMNKSFATKTILLSGFVAGTLDILAAFFVYSVIMKVVTPAQILQGIAAVAFGKTVISNQTIIALLGLLFHFIIAYSFAAAYFFIYPHVRFLHYNKIISGLLYGIIVWAVMNLIVVPLFNGHYAPFVLNAMLRAVIILILCIGLPIAIITSTYYKRISA